MNDPGFASAVKRVRALRPYFSQKDAVSIVRVARQDYGGQQTKVSNRVDASPVRAYVLELRKQEGWTLRRIQREAGVSMKVIERLVYPHQQTKRLSRETAVAIMRVGRDEHNGTQPAALRTTVERCTLANPTSSLVEQGPHSREVQRHHLSTGF